MDRNVFPRSHSQEGAGLALKISPVCLQRPASKLRAPAAFTLSTASEHLLRARPGAEPAQLVGM